MLPLAVLNLENELCTAEKQGSFWFRGHIDTALPTDAQFIIGDNHRRFHSSLLLGGSQEGGIQAESVCVVTRLFRGKLSTFTGMSAVRLNLSVPLPRLMTYILVQTWSLKTTSGISFFGSVFNPWA